MAKYYTVKISRRNLILGLIAVLVALVWMFVLGVWVGQDIIYIENAPKLKITVKNTPKNAKSVLNSKPIASTASKTTEKASLKISQKASHQKPTNHQKPSQPSSSLKLYALKVGAFINKENALEVKRRLNRLGYKAYLTTVKINGQIYYRLYVGPYSLKKAMSSYHLLNTQKFNPTRPVPLK